MSRSRTNGTGASRPVALRGTRWRVLGLVVVTLSVFTLGFLGFYDPVTGILLGAAGGLTAAAL